MSYPYLDLADLQSRAGTDTVRAVFDDVGDVALDDTTPGVVAIIRDACAYVDGFLRVKYDIDAIHNLAALSMPNEIKRLSLDVAFAYMIQRHPKYFRGREWRDLFEAARRDLESLAKGKTRLDIVGSPEPQAGLSVEFIQTEDVDSEGTVLADPRRFTDMGDF